MLEDHAKTKCPLCLKIKRNEELVPGELVRDSVAQEVLQSHPQWKTSQPICVSCLNKFRARHFRKLLEEDKGELSQLEEQVLQSLVEHDAISSNVNEQFEQQLSLGERLSDRMAEFGGSWTFLTLFAVGLVIWMLLNSVIYGQHPFDPFPFILLNLLLSCLAAVQAPIILMSQNRQDARDRLRSEYDYRTDLKTELEVRLLHTKVDQLLTHQWQRLLEIQELQMDLMEELTTRRS